jgi:hypothetical protein
LYETGREITILMGEGALRTRLAAPATMSAQREHIARLAETLTTATIAIVPFTAQAPIATLNGWALTDDLATIETDAGNLEIADPEHVQRYWHHTHLLLDVANTGPDAAALCRQISNETIATQPRHKPSHGLAFHPSLALPPRPLASGPYAREASGSRELPLLLPRCGSEHSNRSVAASVGGAL